MEPQFTHQFFGEKYFPILSLLSLRIFSEKIIGYRNLKVQFYFLASSLIPYVNISFDEKTDKCQDLTVCLL